MGTISITQIVFFSIILLGPIVLPITAIRKENTDNKLARRPFFGWIAGIFLAVPICIAIATILGGVEATTIPFIVMFYILVSYPLFQRIVRRARDAGMGKAVAYWAIFPIVNIIALGILIFVPSKNVTLQDQSERP